MGKPSKATWAVVTGLAMTTVAAMALANQEADARRLHRERLATERLRDARSHLERAPLALDLLTAFFAASDHVRTDEFANFAQRVLDADFGAEWVAWRPAGRSGDTEAPAPYVAPPTATHALAACLLGDQPAATSPTTVAQIHRVADRPLVLLRQRPDQPAGELLVALDPEATLQLAASDFPFTGLELQLCARPAGSTEATVLAHEGAPSPTPRQAHAAPREHVTIGGLGLELRYAGEPLTPGGIPLAAVAAALGILATALAAVGFGSAARTTARANELVRLRTAQLAAANEALEERVTERTRELAAAHREMEAFSYSVSHDLRAPLRAIDGFAGILAEDHGAALPPEAQRVLGVIRSSCRDMGALIDALLRLSRLGRHELAMAPVDVDRLVATVVAESRAAAGSHPPDFDVGPLGWTEADPVLLRELFRNLIGNAVKYSRPQPEPRIVVRRHERDGHAVFTVADNGVGFDPRYADKLFTPFQRLHRSEDFEGTGIGLALCHRIVLRHGGAIAAEGRPGAGATITFSLRAGSPPP